MALPLRPLMMYRHAAATRGGSSTSAAALAGASPLVRERLTASGLGSVDGAEVASPIDEWVRRVLGAGAFAQLAMHAKHVRMRGQEDVRRQAPQRAEATLEV